MSEAAARVALRKGGYGYEDLCVEVEQRDWRIGLEAHSGIGGMFVLIVSDDTAPLASARAGRHTHGVFDRLARELRLEMQEQELIGDWRGRNGDRA